MPVTSEGEQTLTAVDESGNLASTSFFTEYGIGNLRDENEDAAPDQLTADPKLLAERPGPAPSVSPAPSTAP